MLSDALNRLDKLDERKTEDINKIKKDIKRIQIENIENEFKKEHFELLKNDPIVQKFWGEYKCVMSNLQDRTLAFGKMLEELNQLSQQGLIPPHHPLRVTTDWKRKLKNWSTKIFEFQDKKLGINDFLSENHQSDDTQLILNGSFLNKKDEPNDDESIRKYKDIIQKINIIECIMAGEWKNYSSNINTRYELEQKKAGKDRANVPKIQKNKGENLQYKPDDYNKIFNNIYTRFEQCKSTDDLVKHIPDIDVGAIICGEFGIRRATVHLLSIDDIDVSNGVINVPAYKNVKSHVDYTAESDNDLVKDLLRQIVRRAAVGNIEAINSDGEIPIINCSKSNLYKEFKRLEKKTGITTNYKGKTFHALRRLYGQRMYDIYRAEAMAKRPNGELKEWQHEALATVNILLGHNEDEIQNVFSYVRNIW